jgi:hypothetical protein
MATTTNYSWSTPDDTALVKDGAAAIRSLGTAIDTTTYNNSLLPIVKTIVDAKGDIIAATAADTVSRLAVGANDTVLTADSTAATGLKWAAISGGAGNLALITSGSLSGTSLSVSSLSTYTNIYCFFDSVSWSTATGDDLRLRINGVTTSVYRSMGFNQGTGGGASRDDLTLSTSVLVTRPSNANYFSTTNGYFVKLTNCKNTGFTNFDILSTYVDAAGSTRYNFIANGVFESSAAVSSISFATASAFTFNNGTYRIYGE